MLKNRITDITHADLRQLGARGLLLDVDNTLTTHQNPDLEPAVMAWLQGMKELGLRLMVVSNARTRRVEPFAHKIGLPFVDLACKPLPFGFWRAARHLSLPPKQCVVIGDQTFTDILGAKLGGFPCIQVLPIQPEEGLTFRIKRWWEARILKRGGFL